MPPKPKHPCGTCNKSAAKNSIKCNFCDFWHHASPECMVSHTVEQIEMLKELCKERTCWSCYKCSEIMKKLNGRLAAVEKDLNEVKKDLGEVKVKQTATDKIVGDMGTDVEKLKKSIKGNTSNTKSSIMSEMNQREARKSNIIIHGLPEPQVEGAASKETIHAKEEETLNNLFVNMSQSCRHWYNY